MMKLVGTGIAAALLALSLSSYAQAPSQGASPGATVSASIGEGGGGDSADSGATGVASAKPRADWWSNYGLTAADVGEATLPWTTNPKLEDEDNGGY